MDKQVIAGASFTQQKYFFEPKFDVIPESVKDEIRTICIVMAQKLRCTFLMGFLPDGEIYFDVVNSEDDFDFDDIGCELEMKRIKTEEKELIEKLELWYKVFMTEEGKKIKEKLLKEIKE